MQRQPIFNKKVLIESVTCPIILHLCIKCKYSIKKGGLIEGTWMLELRRLLDWDVSRFPYNKKYELFYDNH